MLIAHRIFTLVTAIDAHSQEKCRDSSSLCIRMKVCFINSMGMLINYCVSIASTVGWVCLHFFLVLKNHSIFYFLLSNLDFFHIRRNRIAKWLWHWIFQSSNNRRESQSRIHKSILSHFISPTKCIHFFCVFQAILMRFPVWNGKICMKIARIAKVRLSSLNHTRRFFQFLDQTDFVKF